MAERARQSGGFTLVELSLIIVIIGVLASLGLVVGGRMVRDARVAGERQFLVSLRVAVEQFKQDFNMLPPLVVDGPPATTDPGPLTATGKLRPLVRDEAFLRMDQPGTATRPRWSEHSLSYYLMGLLDVQDNAPSGSQPIDGVAGPGFTRPQPDGTFAQRGASYSAYVDPGRGFNRVFVDTSDAQRPGRIKILDRWGTPVRFYRWLPRYATAGSTAGEVEQYLVPRAVGDPNTQVELRSAQYAIVSLGPDRQTDEGLPLPTAERPDQRVAPGPRDGTVSDDLVEVGR